MEGLPILQKWEDMTVMLYEITAGYPKGERFVLASRTTDATLALGTELALAVPSTIPHVRMAHLERADRELATIKLLANVYLDQLDHFVKETLGVRHYLRYMDDFVLLAPDRASIDRYRARVEDFVRRDLCLNLNPKTRTLRVRDGIECCGARVRVTHITPRRASLRRSYRRLRKLARLVGAGAAGLAEFKQSLMSILGHFSHTASRRSLNRIIIPARRDKR